MCVCVCVYVCVWGDARYVLSILNSLPTINNLVSILKFLVNKILKY